MSNEKAIKTAINLLLDELKTNKTNLSFNDSVYKKMEFTQLLASWEAGYLAGFENRKKCSGINYYQCTYQLKKPQ